MPDDMVNISYLYNNTKIFISSDYNYFDISGTLEANLSFYGNVNLTTGEKRIISKNISIVADTKNNKCLNIDFEFVNDKYVDLIIRYNNRLNMFNLFILSADIELEYPVLSYEDISKIQEWY